MINKSKPNVLLIYAYLLGLFISAISACIFRQEPTAESSSVTTGARRLPPWQNIPSVEKKKAPKLVAKMMFF